MVRRRHAGRHRLAWLVIEIGIVRRIAQLTRRTRGLSKTVHADGGLERFDLADLRGSDELGILASGLNDLLRRVKEDAERERIRAGQEKGHVARRRPRDHVAAAIAAGAARQRADPSHRYISRMQQAVRILYGSASPSEAFQTSSLQVQALDIAGFLRNVAANAAGAGIADVRVRRRRAPVPARADDYPLEDVFAHILKNADRYRDPGTPIVLSLASTDSSVIISIRNAGPRIPEELIGSIFEYGVSDQPEAGAHGNRGQGLFVAKTYMAKMGVPHVTSQSG